MKKYVTHFFSLGLALMTMLSVCAVPNQSSAATYTATVNRVVDGDTVYLKETIKGTYKIRMLSIDAPETHYQNHAQDPWGTEASDYLTKLLPAGTKVTIETDENEVDSYGRLLAHIYKGSLDVNKEMIRQGHAVSYYIYPNMLHFSEYQAAYLEAKQAGRGIWNPSNPITELPFEFRDQVSGTTQDKYVGNYDTKKYVDPSDYKQIPIEKRVFFFKEEDAIAAGFEKGDGSTTPTPTPSNLYINEVLPNPSTAYTKEFVEIYNPGSTSVNIGGYILDDIVDGGSSPYTIPTGTTIPAGGYYVWEPTNYYNNSGDSVTLKAPDGKIIDEFTYGSSGADKSWVRIPNGGEWSSTMSSTPTKGAANK